jgi:hypothetical protein
MRLDSLISRENVSMEISKRTRLKFGEFATDYAVLRLINQAFIMEDFEPVADYSGPEYGERRTLVAAYHAAIDFNDPTQVARLINVYLEAINTWGRDSTTNELLPGASDLAVSLRRDGVPISDQAELTGPLPPLRSARPIGLDRFDRLGEPRVVQQHLDRIAANIGADPAASVGSSKELVESVCKFILDDFAVEYGTRDDLLDLYKKVAKELSLNRESVPTSAKGSQAAQRVLQNLATAVQSLAELRNELGIGHGRTKSSPAFARHARLASNAARTVVEFFLETWHERRRAESASSASA